jgi:hypothetical protein
MATVALIIKLRIACCNWSRSARMSDISWKSCVVSEVRVCLTFGNILSKTTRATELDSAFCLPTPILVTSRAALGSCAKLRCRQSKETMVESSSRSALFDRCSARLPRPCISIPANRDRSGNRLNGSCARFVLRPMHPAGC